MSSLRFFCLAERDSSRWSQLTRLFACLLSCASPLRPSLPSSTCSWSFVSVVCWSSPNRLLQRGPRLQTRSHNSRRPVRSTGPEPEGKSGLARVCCESAGVLASRCSPASIRARFDCSGPGDLSRRREASDEPSARLFQWGECAQSALGHWTAADSQKHEESRTAVSAQTRNTPLPWTCADRRDGRGAVCPQRPPHTEVDRTRRGDCSGAPSSRRQVSALSLLRTVAAVGCCR